MVRWEHPLQTWTQWDDGSRAMRLSSSKLCKQQSKDTVAHNRATVQSRLEALHRREVKLDVELMLWIQEQVTTANDGKFIIGVNGDRSILPTTDGGVSKE